MFCMKREEQVENFCEDYSCEFVAPCYEIHVKDAVRLSMEKVDELINNLPEINEEGFQVVFEQEEFLNPPEEEVQNAKQLKKTKKSKETNIDDLDLFL